MKAFKLIVEARSMESGKWEWTVRGEGLKASGISATRTDAYTDAIDRAVKIGADVIEFDPKELRQCE